MYSIQDTMEELAANPEAMEIAAKAFKLTMKYDCKTGRRHVGYDESHDSGKGGRDGQVPLCLKDLWKASMPS